MEEQVKTNVEIQAITFLRFISIALVLLSHNPFHAFKIGVLGVDIFFLISGFLITKQIEDLLERYPKKEAVKLFYFRRARRILPSLIATLIFTLVTYRFIASSTLFNLARETSLPALGFFANFFLNSQNSQYFNFAKLNPLASFWSLSTEEQLYLLLPLLLIIFITLKLNRKVLPVLLATVSLLYIATVSTPEKYYNPISRLLPFSLGAILLYQPNIFNKIKINRTSYLGLLTIFLFLARDVNIVNYPNIYITIPLILTLFFLGSNISKNYKLNTFKKASKLIGLASYNIYLVYLPLIILIESKAVSQTRGYLLALTLALFFGYLLYRFDFKVRSKVKSFKSLAKLLLVLLSVFALTYTLLGNIKTSNITINNPSIEISNLKSELKIATLQGYATLPQEEYLKQLDPPAIFPAIKKSDGTLGPCTGLNICEKNLDSSIGTLFLLADSTGEPISPILAKLAKENNLNLVWFNLTGCDPSGIPLDDWNITDGYTTKKCEDFYSTLPKALEKYSNSGKFSIVYEQASSPLRTYNRVPPTTELKDRYYKQTIALLKKYSKHITLISEVPFNKNPALDCLGKTMNTKDCVFTPSDPLNNYLSVNNAIKAKAEKVNYIDLREYLCLTINKTIKCPAVVDNLITYRDILHASPTYLNSISNLLLPQFDLA